MPCFSRWARRRTQTWVAHIWGDGKVNTNGVQWKGFSLWEFGGNSSKYNIFLLFWGELIQKIQAVYVSPYELRGVFSQTYMCKCTYTSMSVLHCVIKCVRFSHFRSLKDKKKTGRDKSRRHYYIKKWRKKMVDIFKKYLIE